MIASIEIVSSRVNKRIDREREKREGAMVRYES